MSPETARATKISRVGRHAWFLVVLALLLAGCAQATPLQPVTATSPLAAPTPGALALTIVHSNDSWGYLDPCG